MTIHEMIEKIIYHTDEIDQDVVVDIVLNRILSASICDQSEFLYQSY